METSGRAVRSMLWVCRVSSLLGLLVDVPFVSAAGEYQIKSWEAGPASMPDVRAYFGFVHIPAQTNSSRGDVMVAGGIGAGVGGVVFASVCMYSVDAATWRKSSTEMPGKRALLAMVHVPALDGGGRGDVIAVGGRDGNDKVLDSVSIYNVDKETWRTSSTKMPGARYDFAMVHVPALDGGGRGDVIVAGGYDGNDKVLDSVSIYNVDEETWSKSSTKMPVARYAFAMVHVPALDGRGRGDVIVAGGFDGVSIYSVDAKTWSTSTEMPVPSYEFAMVHVPALDGGGRGDVIAAGGYYVNYKTLDSVSIYSVDKATWSTSSTKMPVARYAFGMLYVPALNSGERGQVMVAGGRDESKTLDSVYFAVPAATVAPPTTTAAATTVTTATTTVTLTSTTTTVMTTTATITTVTATTITTATTVKLASTSTVITTTMVSITSTTTTIVTTTTATIATVTATTTSSTETTSTATVASTTISTSTTSATTTTSTTVTLTSTSMTTVTTTVTLTSTSTTIVTTTTTATITTTTATTTTTTTTTTITNASTTVDATPASTGAAAGGKPTLSGGAAAAIAIVLVVLGAAAACAAWYKGWVKVPACLRRTNWCNQFGNHDVGGMPLVADMFLTPLSTSAPQATIELAGATTTTSSADGASAAGPNPGVHSEAEEEGAAPTEVAAAAATKKKQRKSKFVANTIRLGRATQSAAGLADLMGYDDMTMMQLIMSNGGGTDAIVHEINANGTEEDKQNLRALLDGSYTTPHDTGGPLGDLVAQHRTLDELMQTAEAKTAKLTRANVLGLLLYTTSSYTSINNPLRTDPATQPHPFAATTYFASQGIKLLRTVAGNLPDAHEAKVLWRGLKDMTISDVFMTSGGTEFAFMSTSSSREVAFDFADSTAPMILMIETKDFMSRGADISVFSVYPGEGETLYPPLTYLRAIAREIKVIRRDAVPAVDVPAGDCTRNQSDKREEVLGDPVRAGDSVIGVLVRLTSKLALACRTGITERLINQPCFVMLE